MGALCMDLTITALPAEANPVLLDVELAWDPADPLCVVLTLAGPRQSVVWLVGRDLLAAGLDGPAGLGDVAVVPDPWYPATVELVLDPGTDRLALLIDRRDLTLFLETTWRYVPAGAERVTVPAPDELARETDGHGAP
jgi:hypothetical protein